MNSSSTVYIAVVVPANSTVCLAVALSVGEQAPAEATNADNPIAISTADPTSKGAPPETSALAEDAVSAATASSPLVSNASQAPARSSGARTVGEDDVSALETSLRCEERSKATIEKYLRDVRRFAEWLEDRPLDHEQVAAYKQVLIDSGAAPATVNVKLAAVNALLGMLNRKDCCVHNLKVQRRVFRDEGRDLRRDEYLRLVGAAYARGKERLGLAMETICATGMRVSELRYVTVEALSAGRVTIRCKGKARVVLLPAKLLAKLRDYAARMGLEKGPVFVTCEGHPLSRRQIWGEMKSICGATDVPKGKVFPHNLRHLFAVEYYRENHDIAKLADLLGHSSIETTRIYLLETGTEHQRQLDGMGLVTRQQSTNLTDVRIPA